MDVVDLPHPDSPTRPTLSPGAIVKLMPLTARNGVDAFPLRPKSLASTPVVALREYSLMRFSTVSSAGVFFPLPLAGEGTRPSGGEGEETPGRGEEPSPSGSRSRSPAPRRGVAFISLRV